MAVKMLKPGFLNNLLSDAVQPAIISSVRMSTIYCTVQQNCDAVSFLAVICSPLTRKIILFLHYAVTCRVRNGLSNENWSRVTMGAWDASIEITTHVKRFILLRYETIRSCFTECSHHRCVHYWTHSCPSLSNIHMSLQIRKDVGCMKDVAVFPNQNVEI